MDVIRFCNIGLKVGGSAVMKIIQGPETDEIIELVNNKFQTV